MNQGLKAKVKALEWYVLFVNQDLGRIDVHDKAKLLTEAKKYLFPQNEMKEFQEGLPLPPRLPSKLKWVQNDIDLYSPQVWKTILRQQKSIRKLFDQYLLPTTHPTDRKAKKHTAGAPGIYIRGETTFLWKLTKGFCVPYHLVLIPVSPSKYEFVQLKIIGFLEGLPQHAIALCQNCQAYFLNWTLKPKRFCGDECIRQAAQKRRRQSEKYREYQRKYMYDHYEPKIGRRGRPQP